MKLGSIQGGAQEMRKVAVKVLWVCYRMLDVHPRKESRKREKGFTYSKISLETFLSRTLRLYRTVIIGRYKSTAFTLV